MTVAAVRAEVAALGRRYSGQRYPAELRERIIELARAMRGDGAGWDRIGAEVGVRGETLRRWCGVKRAERMVPVHVVADQSAVAVVSPSGWRIEGLSLADAAALLRAMP